MLTTLQKAPIDAVTPSTGQRLTAGASRKRKKKADNDDMRDNDEGDHMHDDDDDDDDDDDEGGGGGDKNLLKVGWWKVNRDSENSGRLVVHLLRTLRHCVVVHHAIAFGSKRMRDLTEVLNATEQSFEVEYGKRPVKSTYLCFA
jgi:hypothetical protein